MSIATLYLSLFLKGNGTLNGLLLNSDYYTRRFINIFQCSELNNSQLCHCFAHYLVINVTAILSRICSCSVGYGWPKVRTQVIGLIWCEIMCFKFISLHEILYTFSSLHIFFFVLAFPNYPQKHFNLFNLFCLLL